MYSEQGLAILSAIQSGSRSQFEAALNTVTWSTDAVQSMQDSIVNGPFRDRCISFTEVSL